MRAIARRLVDSQKRLAGVKGCAEEIIREAEEMEDDATQAQKRLRRRLPALSGARRTIAEAEYLDAVDRKRRAAQAGAMARQTLAKIG